MQPKSFHPGENTSMQLARPVWNRGHALEREPESVEALPPSPDEVFAADPHTLVIEEGCSIDGRLVTDRSILVLGDACGTIESTSIVRVAEGGSVQGDIRARSIFILGAVVGSVTGRREVVLCATGRLHGDVVTSCFELERGGFFEGHAKMLRPQDTGWRTLESTPVDVNAEAAID